jgi:glycosidase
MQSHHPGPPRFAAVGDTIELAPRDPDPEAESAYRWRIARAPAESTATVGDDPVEHFEPDAPGLYVAVLAAPAGEHELTLRVFPGDLAPGGGGDGGGGAEGVYGSGAEAGIDRGAIAGETGDESDGRSGASGGTSGVSGDADADTDADGAAEGAGEGEGGGGRPRVELRTRVSDDGEAVVAEADPRPHPSGAERASDLGVEFLIDDRDDLSREDVQQEGTRLRIPLDRLPEHARIYAVSVGRDEYSVPDAVALARDGLDGGAGSDPDAERESDDATGADSGTEAGAESGGIKATRLYDPPAWATDAVIYEIYVRTFAGAEAGTEGEDSPFDAIEARLDYIADLGVDVVWLTPVLENDHAPHGYNITDFFAIAEDLGGREDYEALVEAAHERDIKVLFDLVLNHSARTHPYFEAAVADPDSEYRDWYEWEDAEAGEPGTYFDWEYIANFDFDALSVRRHLLDAVDEWAPLVDGFRCDMAWAVPNGFWRELHDRLKDRDPEFLLLDETIPYIPDFQAGLFDVHFDSTTAFALREVGAGHQPAEAVPEAVAERTEIGFPDRAGFMLYCENHDESRYIVECGEEAAMAAAGALFTLPGAPMLYAGQELGQRGRRDALVWEHAREDLQAHYERFIETRKAHPALSTAAAMAPVDATVREGDPRSVVAYGRVAGGGERERSQDLRRQRVQRQERDPEPDRGQEGGAEAGTGEEAVVVVLNFGDGTATVEVDPEVKPIDLATGESVASDGGAGTAVQVADAVVLPATPEAITGDGGR